MSQAQKTAEILNNDEVSTTAKVEKQPQPIVNPHETKSKKQTHEDELSDMKALTNKSENNDTNIDELVVTLYSEPNYQGNAHALSCGRYNSRDLGIADNSLSSLRVPQGLRVTIFTFPEFAGAQMNYSRNIAYIGDFFNNKTSSVIISKNDNNIIPIPQKPQDKVPTFIFSESDYHGKKQALFPGRYNTADLEIGDDSLSAIRVPKGLKITLYEDSDFQGLSRSYTRSTPYVGDFFNNKTSSLIVGFADDVKIFNQANYLGDSQTLAPGRYNIQALKIDNNSLSSIQIPKGLKVTLFTDADFQGSSISYCRNTPYLGDFFNNRTSSLLVEYARTLAQNTTSVTDEIGRVTLYEGMNYTGQSHQLTLGQHNTRDLGIANNSLSSLRIPTGLKATIFEYPSFAGAKTSYTRNIPYIGDFFNNKTSSIIISKDDGKPAQAPAKPQDKIPAFIYSEANYRGKKQVLFPGRYNTADLEIGDDSLSAIRIPAGLKITIFEDHNFKGASMTYHRNTPYIGDFFNNKTSSLIVAYEQEVKIYTQANYQGKQQSLDIGRYDCAELSIGEDSLSALQVPKGLKVTLYEHTGFKGASMSYNRSTPYVGDYFNNKTSSLIIDYANVASQSLDKHLTPAKMPPKRSLQFDGQDDHISIEVNFTHNAHTLSLWFKTSSPDGGLFSVDAQVLDKTGQDRHLYLQDGNLCARLWNDEIICTQGQNYADNQWHKVSHVFGGDIGGQCLYVDGKVKTKGQKIASNFFRQTRLYIGYSNDAPQAYFKGLIAEVALWSHARSDHSLHHWKTAVTGYETKLLGFWNCQYLHNGSTQLNDHSPYAHHGKIHGAATSVDIDDFPAEFVRQIMQTAQNNHLRIEADSFAHAGKILGQAYKTKEDKHLTCKTLSQWVAEGNLAHYKLMNQLNNAVHNGSLQLNAKMLGSAYADIIEHIPMLDIFIPIHAPKCGFFKNHAGHIGNSGTILDENPEDCSKLASLDDYALKIAGNVEILGQYKAKLAYADFSYSQGLPQCAFKYQLEQSLALNTLLPAIPILAGLDLKNATLIAASSDQLFDPELNTSMELGLNFFGQVDINTSHNPRLKFLNQALQTQTLNIQGVLDPQGSHINAALKPAQLLQSPHFSLAINRCDMSLSLQGQPSRAHISLRQDLKLSLNYHGKTTHLYFNGGMILSQRQISNAYSMNGKAQTDHLETQACNNHTWENPFAIQGIKIHGLSIKLDCAYQENWLENVGIHGKLQIGKQQGHIALMLSCKKPEHYALRGEIEGLQVQDLLAQLAPESYINYTAQAKTRNKLFKTLMNSPLSAGQIHIIPTACQIGGIRFRDAGIHIYGQQTLWGSKTSLHIQTDAEEGLHLQANLDPVKLGNIFSLNKNQSCAPVLNCQLNAHDHPSIKVDANVSVFAIPHQGKIKARKNGLRFNFKQSVSGLGDLQLNCRYKQQQFKAQGILDLLLNSDIFSDFGWIKLQDVHCVLRTKIRMDAQQNFEAQLKGYFVLWGQVVSLPTMRLHVAPRDFQGLHQRVLKLIKDQANTLLEDLLFSVEDWRIAVSQNRIRLHDDPAAISHGMYRCTEHATAQLYQAMGETADKLAQDLRRHYQIDAASTTHALRYADYSDTDISQAVEKTYHLGASNMAIVLKQAGFTLHEIANLIKTQYNSEHTDMARALKTAGYGLEDIGDCLRQTDDISPNMIYQLLKQIGFSEREIKVFFSALGGDFATLN